MDACFHGRTYKYMPIYTHTRDTDPHTPLIFTHISRALSLLAFFTVLSSLMAAKWLFVHSLTQWQQLCPPFKASSRHLPCITPGGFGSVCQNQFTDIEYSGTHMSCSAMNHQVFSVDSFYFTVRSMHPLHNVCMVISR